MRTVSAFLLSTALGAGALGAAVTMRPSAPPASPTEEWDRRPGPDSGRVAIMLDALGRTDPIVCEMIADQIGNFWTDGERASVGRFAAEPAAQRAAKDSIGGRVSDPRALDRLVAELSASRLFLKRTFASCALR